MNDRLRNLYCQNPAVKVRDHFLDFPDQSAYGQKLSRTLKISAGAVHGALKELFRQDLLAREPQGRTLVYFLNRQVPTVRALQIIRSIELLTGLVERLSPHIRELYLFGRAAAGEYATRSDLDIAVIAADTADINKVEERLSTYRAERKIRPLVFTARQWQELERQDPARFLEITRGIKLYGSDRGANT